VAYPPLIPEKEWPLMRSALVECLRVFQPFNITLKEVGTFAGSTHVLWLKPEDGGNLSRIHVTLSERFPDYVPALPFDYIPHLTVGFFNSQQALSQAQEAILSGIKALHFRVDELIYMVLDSDGVWGIRDRLPLE
jgi:2'-5' RNA ligase